MNTIIVSFSVLALLVLPAVGQDKKEEARVANAGTVISEIMNIPDNVPQDTIDKADCVVVLPSVLKLAFGIGGSYGRGVMTCRGGKTFHGPWSAPTMMALEGGSFGLQLGGQATDFVLLLMSPKSASNILGSKVKLGGDISAAAGPVGAMLQLKQTPACGQKYSLTLVPGDSSLEYRWRGQLFVQTMTPTRNCTARK